MTRIGKHNKKWIASFFLSLLVVQNLFPVVAYALTSGPAQPEMQKFEPAGASDMVDLFSGDFKYNIPLLDVGGYPVNLSYHSGGSMEDEASWVGSGWSLNPGVMSRTMRGIPDDFTGDQSSPSDPPDLIKTIQHKKEFKKIGGQLVLKPSIFGWEFGSASLHLGVYKDNYYGIGGEVGASVSFSADNSSATTLTAGLGLNSDPRTGVTVSPSFSLSSSNDDLKETNSGTLSGGLSYNTRTGLQQVNLGQSFGLGSVTLTKDFVHTYTPTFYTNTSTQNTTFSFDLGAQLFGGYLGIGGSGYVYKESNLEPHSSVPAYGYLNYSSGRKNVNALLDFNREKDGVFIKNAPAIPIPVATEDYFDATSQAGSQEFRPFYNGDYTIFDRTFTKKDNSLDGGFTLGAGNVFQGGARLDLTKGSAVTRKWTTNNLFLGIAEPSSYTGAGKEVYENVYFKKAGEQTTMSDQYYSAIGKDETQKVPITAHAVYDAATFPLLQGASTSTGVPIRRQDRDIRTSSFSYLTARQAAIYGLDKQINGAPRVDNINADPTTTVHKAHHISEITVTDNDGKRMVYGIPVYNTDQEEVSFSVKAPTTNVDAIRKTGLISYTPGTDNSENNTNGRDNTYTRKVIPPYATSYLLTGVLSPDYVDKTGDGISDDDLGTAVKLNYTKLNGNYTWRAPYEFQNANYNEGFLSDKQDDKANYVFGQKEIWYLQSIGSKTMIAQFFISNRNDALGAAGENGGQNATLQLQKLDSIRLFSKADLLKNGPAAAIPIKVAHFEYDYSLYPGIPNNLVAGQGKLTLKKVYFTFGSGSRGQSNPYLFSYDMRLIRDGSIANLPAAGSQDAQEQADNYTQRQVDRWGTYKQSFYNPPQINSTNALNNSEYPYALQVADRGNYDERLLADRFASKWQLNSITTPTGGIISVEYESDDYAYVQDRKAMTMCPLAGVMTATDANLANGLNNATKLYVKVPVPPTHPPDPTDPSYPLDFINTYLSGPDGKNWSNISYKIFTDIDNKGHWEFVYGYAEIDYGGTFDIQDNIVGIPVKAVNNYNPVSKAAWQMIQTDLPQFAYENYDNSDANSLGDDVQAAVRSIVQAFVNLRELFEPYDKIAFNSHYADKVNLSKSLVRLNYPVGKPNGGSNAARPTYGKLGGGSRVRDVKISDDWNNMTGAGTATKTAVYGLKYEYTKLDDNGKPVSSGVASYEPQIGNEENPFHEPLDYTEKVQWSADRYHYIEKPFGESYFPGPSVGYSEVKMTAYGSDYTDTNPILHTGYTIAEFYTSRDFPTQVDYIPLEEKEYENDLTLLLFASAYTKRVATTQGFKITTNDMHGKQKAMKIYDKSGALLSSSEYFYNVIDDKAQRQQLNNTVLALDPAYGSIPAAGELLGTDAELVTDVRESASSSRGTSIGAYVGGLDLIWFIPFVGINYNQTASVRTYNSVSSVKVIHQYGIVKQVRTTQNGSTLTATNVLWDGQTGSVLLTQNQNEFDDYTYAFHYPAYMAYDGMGSTYRNIGTVLTGFQTDVTGKPTAANGAPIVGNPYYLSPGDELVEIDPGSTTRGWILQSSDGSLRFIDKDGQFITGTGNYRILRSGRRNILDAAAGTVVSLTNPLVQSGSSYTLQLGVDKKVLDAKAVTYKDEWEQPIGQLYRPYQSTLDSLTDCISNILLPAIAKINQDQTPQRIQRAIFSTQDQGITAGTLIGDCLFGKCPTCNRNFLNGQLPSTFPFYQTTQHLVTLSSLPLRQQYQLQAGDIARLGDYQIVFDMVSPSFDSLANLTLSEADMNTELAKTYPYVAAGNVSEQVPKYCVIKESPQHWLLRRTNTSSVPDGSSFDYSDCGTANPYATYTDLLRFHIIGGNIVQYHCVPPLDSLINPYYLGIKGNWRADSNYVYQVNRVQVPGDPSQKGGTNIRTSGYYASFTPYWTLAGHSFVSIPLSPGSADDHSLIDARWVWSNQPIHFDAKGNEIENVDALKRYSSALYGYQQSLATAVASNARHNEIAFDGFEDYYFSLPVNTADPCPPQHHLDLGLIQTGNQFCNSGNCVVAGTSHSGNYSLNLASTITVSKPAGNADPSPHVIGFDVVGRCILVSNEQAAGFAPINGKKYLLSLWVKDANPNSNLITGLQVNINGASEDLSNTRVPVVEGWKKLDLCFTAGSSFSLQLTGDGSIYIDDLRILPFDAQLKSFVYDDQSLRLVGQLDENNFGVFYEYDEEGTPVRVKKETERGLMTIKESRQSFRQH